MPLENIGGKNCNNTEQGNKPYNQEREFDGCGQEHHKVNPLA